MRLNALALVPSALMLLSALGCSGAVVQSGETTDDVAAASSTAGVSASLSVSKSGTSYTATMTVTNGSAEPVYNWQVVVNMNKSTIAVTWAQPSGTASVNGAFVNDFGSNTLFVPTSSTASIAAGGKQTITWSGTYSATPTIVSVDGVASGTALTGNAADGIDPISLTAATAAYKMAIDYEKGKLANNGDSNYPIYDQTIWSAQTFRVASNGTTIEFDPNAPGYAFVPNSSKVDLAVAQLDATVASYLTAGLNNCFAVTDGSMTYAFRADFLKGFNYPTKNSGSITNPDGSVDAFNVVGAPLNKGQQVITINASSGPTSSDPWFGIMRYLNAASTFPTYWSAVYPKFSAGGTTIGTNPSSWHGHYAAACSPFNGPGGSSNPYFVLNQTINGVKQTMNAWFQGVGSQSCNNGCSATFQVDPIPYTQPAAYYDTTGTLVGPQANPFALSIVSLYADPAHAGQWATRTVAGVQQWGTFSTPISVLGTTIYMYVKVM